MSIYFHDRPMEQVEAMHYADSFAGRLEDLERRALELGSPGLLAQADQAHAHFRYVQAASLEALTGIRR